MTTFFLAPDGSTCINADAIAKIEVSTGEAPGWGVKITSRTDEVWMVAAGMVSFAEAAEYIVLLATLLANKNATGGGVVMDGDVRRWLRPWPESCRRPPNLPQHDHAGRDRQGFPVSRPLDETARL